MNELFRAIRVEVFKLRRTLALWSSLLIPAVVIAMTMAVNLSRSQGTEFVLDHPNGWDTLSLTKRLFSGALFSCRYSLRLRQLCSQELNIARTPGNICSLYLSTDGPST